MRTVYKYEVSLGNTLIKLPEKSRLLHFDRQEFCLFVWIELDNEDPLVWMREFQVIGTGQPVPHNFMHMKSIKDGQFMWHLYEKLI